ncbi:MAG: tetratricopeptide repeat protein, partial [Bacteroidota bacterium]
MRLTNILPLLFFTLIIFSCSEDAQEADFNAIADSFKSTNQDSVVFYAQKSLSLNLGDKHDYYSYFLIAESYQRQKNYSLALTNYLESQRLIPKESIFDYYRYATNNNLGKIFKMYSNYELAIKHYRKALDYVEDKNKASLLYNLGNAYTSSGQYEKATKAYLDSKEIAVQQNDELRQARLHH